MKMNRILTAALVAVLLSAPAGAQSFADILGQNSAAREQKARRLDPVERKRAGEAQSSFSSVPTPDRDPAEVDDAARNVIYDPTNKAKAAAMDRELDRALKTIQDWKARNPGQRPPAELIANLRKAAAPYLRLMVAAQRDAAKLQGPLVVAPGTRRLIRLEAFCMDLGLPAPKPGETFQIEAIDTLLPKELRAALKAAVAMGAKGHGQAQHLVWQIRNAYRDGRPVDLSAEELAGIRATSPGATEGIQQYNDRISRAKLTRNLLDAALPGLRSSVGNLANTINNLSPAAIKAEVEERMRQLEAMPVNGDIDPAAAYSQPAPGIAMKSYSPSGGASEVFIEIANTSDQPFTFTPAEFAAVSTRSVQHLAIGVPKMDKPASQEDLDDPCSYPEGNPFKDQSKEVTRQLCLDKAINKLIALMVEADPEMGMIKAAFEVVAGYDPITGEKQTTWQSVTKALPFVARAKGMDRTADLLEWRNDFFDDGKFWKAPPGL